MSNTSNHEFSYHLIIINGDNYRVDHGNVYNLNTNNPMAAVNELTTIYKNKGCLYKFIFIDTIKQYLESLGEDYLHNDYFSILPKDVEDTIIKLVMHENTTSAGALMILEHITNTITKYTPHHIIELMNINSKVLAFLNYNLWHKINEK